MAFFLFLLVNVGLFIRPAEIVPALLGWEIYFYAILACLIVGAPDVLKYLTGQSLDAQPITLTVFGLLIAILIPSFMMGDLATAWQTGFLFVKIIVYYLLFVSLVTTPARLRAVLTCILVCCGAITMLAVLRYHDVIKLDTIKSLGDSVAGKYGEALTIQRLQGTGIFQDPNELCVLLAAMVPIGMYFLCAGHSLILRVLSAAMLPLFGYAIYLTHSRGGLIAFASGLGALSWSRFGWKKTALLGMVGLPALLVLFGGRQTEISTSTGTAHTRVELWREWLTTFRENMAFGKGMTVTKEEDAKTRRPDEDIRLAAHNSYLQCLADLGLFGGCLFTGAFVTAIWSIARINARDCLLLNLDLKEVQPYVLACVAAYAVGMMSLSISYIIPTYMMLALSVAYTRMATRACLAPPPPLRFDLSLLGRYLAAGVGVAVSIYVFVRFLA